MTEVGSSQPLTEPTGAVVPSSVPTHWYNLAADLPEPCPPPLHPGTQRAARPGGPRAAVPDGPDPAGGLHRALRRDPADRPRDLRAVAAVAR